MPEDETPIEEPTPEEPPPVEPPPEEPVEPIRVTEDARMKAVYSAEGILEELKPLIRDEDINAVRQKAYIGDTKAVVQYIVDNIPYVKERVVFAEGDDPEVALSKIRSVLRERAKSLLSGQVVPPPWLGGEVSEARSKQEDFGTRYTTQYGRVPFSQTVYQGRNVVTNPYYNDISRYLIKPTRRSPKKCREPRIKFL